MQQKKYAVIETQKTFRKKVENTCRNLPDFDMQPDSTPEQNVDKLAAVVNKCQAQIKTLEIEHQARIAEMELRLIPGTPQE